MVYHAFAAVKGTRYLATIHEVVGQEERIFGREVLNQYVVTFDGKKQRVTFQD